MQASLASTITPFLNEVYEVRFFGGSEVYSLIMPLKEKL